jgi:hypothetical protein
LFNGFVDSYKTLTTVLANSQNGEVDVDPDADPVGTMLSDEPTVQFVRSILFLLAGSVVAAEITTLSGVVGGKQYSRRRRVVKRQYKTKRKSGQKINKGKKYITRKIVRRKYKGKTKSSNRK